MGGQARCCLAVRNGRAVAETLHCPHSTITNVLCGAKVQRCVCAQFLISWESREFAAAALPRLFFGLSCYARYMTKLLDDAMEAARNLPDDTQDSIARVVLRLAGNDDETPVPLSPAERAAIAISKAAASRGEFATDDQVRAVWAKHSL